jgi:hypothetical protein
MFDPETFKGDYLEAYQRWHYRFNKAEDAKLECFKDPSLLPFISNISPTPPSGWMQFRKAITDHFDQKGNSNADY